MGSTPNANIDRLETLWREINQASAAELISPVNNFVGLAAAANNAMAELVEQASNNEFVRALFAKRHVFTTALTAEFGNMDVLFASPSLKGWRVPRLVMLQGLIKAGVGGFMTAADPKGVTSWIGSVAVAGGALSSTLLHDTGEMRLAALDCLLNVAIPVEWAQLFTDERTLEQLEELIPRTAWSSDARQQVITATKLQAGVVKVRGRMLMIQALVAQGQLPSFLTGDGAAAMTAPGRNRVWYKRPEVWGSALGLSLGGVFAGARAKR